jgi:hypothetical protein
VAAPRRSTPCLTGAAPSVRAWPILACACSISAKFGDAVPAPSISESDKTTIPGAKPAPGAEPSRTASQTAGHSRRLTSGGEAVILEASSYETAFDLVQKGTADVSSILVPFQRLSDKGLRFQGMLYCASMSFSGPPINFRKFAGWEGRFTPAQGSTALSLNQQSAMNTCNLERG